MDEAGVFSEPSTDELNSQEPPSPREMWKLLKRIETNTSALLEENRGLRKSLEYTQSEVQELKTCNERLSERIKLLEERDEVANKTIQALKEKLDDIERHSRKFNLEIHGIPEKEEENICQIILELAEVIDADIRAEVVDICHRLYKGEGKGSLIIVKFTNYDSKYEIYCRRFRLRQLNLMGKFNVGRAMSFVIIEQVFSC